MMLRQRGTTAIILLTLALAIGANTAVFSAVHTVLIRPLPYQQPESLVMLWEKREAEGVMKNSVSAADYLDWARIATSFTAMAAFTEVTADLTGEGDPEKLTVGAVSPPFFDVFGVRPLHRPHVRSGRGRDRPTSRRRAGTRRCGGSVSAATPRRWAGTIMLNGVPHPGGRRAAAGRRVPARRTAALPAARAVRRPTSRRRARRTTSVSTRD